MAKRVAFVLALATFVPPGAKAAQPDPVSLVKPLVGTAPRQAQLGVFGHGGTFPGATVPFGMIQWTPFTDPAGPGGYHHGARRVLGFPVTALSGPGCAAFGDVSFMPWPGRPPRDRRALLSRRGERARPGYYRAVVGSPKTVVELTAAARSGLARFTFPRRRLATIAVSPSARSGGSRSAGIRAAGRRRLEGTVVGREFCGRRAPYRLRFAAEFDRPFRRGGGWVGFDTRRRRTVAVRVAISYVSGRGARRNSRTGTPGFRFHAMRRAAAASWRRLLGRVRVEGGGRARQRRLYTALYHSFLHPNRYSDADGSYRSLDGFVNRVRGRTLYTNVAGWDAYRSWAPLLAVLAPGTARDLARSLTDAAGQCGAVPRWLLAGHETGVLVGDGGSATLAVLDAFGVRGYPRRPALRVMLRGAEQPGTTCNHSPARAGLESYLRLGYVPAAEPGVFSPSATTLEYASADFAIAMLAGRLGDTAARDRLLARARGAWRELLAPDGLVRPRDAVGAFLEGDAALGPAHFAEGNAWQYTWLVPHDLRALIAALGGPTRAEARLDTLLTRLNAGLEPPFAFLGNEPSLLLPWIYNWAGRPWKTQAAVRRALDSLYAASPDGLPGNDDLGALSSWSVWAALGLYPAIPGTDGLTVASPVFRRVTLGAGRRRLVIEARGRGRYVRSLALGRTPVGQAWIPWSRLRRGGTLRFALAAQPSGWAAGSPPP